MSFLPGMSATRIVETTRDLRPAQVEVGRAAATSQAMQGVLAGGMDPAKIGARVVRAIENGDYWIFTHPEWKAMAELVTRDMLTAFGESADPAYRLALRGVQEALDETFFTLADRVLAPLLAALVDARLG